MKPPAWSVFAKRVPWFSCSYCCVVSSPPAADIEPLRGRREYIMPPGGGGHEPLTATLEVDCVNGAGDERCPVRQVPSTGWIRSTDLFAGGLAYEQYGTEERRKVLWELSKGVDHESLRDMPLGIKQPMSVPQELLSMFLFFLFPGCMLWVPFTLAGTAWAAYRYLNPPLQALYVLILAVLCFKPLSHWPSAMETWLTVHMLRYTSSSTAWEAPLDEKEGPYLLVCPPHGVLPVGNIISMMTFRRLWGFNFKALTTDAALRLPMMRHVMTWIGCQGAGSKEAMQMVKDGWSVGLCPGGVAEIFDSNNDNEMLYLKARKGFVKLALRMGTPIVPCYTFGNTRLFYSWHDPWGILKGLSRKLGFGVLPIWGRLLLPVIRRQPLMCVVGRPVVTPKATPEPTQEDIDLYHDRFVTELCRIFEKYKGPYGWADKELIIS